MDQTDTYQGRNEKGQFLPGNNVGSRGRPKGARNRLGAKFLDDLQKDWDENGKQVIAAARETRPAEYLRVVASLVPKEFNVSVEPIGDLADDDLERHIHEVSAALGYHLTQKRVGLPVGGEIPTGEGEQS